MLTSTIEVGYAGITYIEYEHEITVVMLVTKEQHRMQGWGGKALSLLCDLADAKGLPIYLTAQPISHGLTTLPLLPLRDFYMRRGFQPRADQYDNAFVRKPLSSIATADTAG